jgi:pilus assembly protein Flp/PilA
MPGTGLPALDFKVLLGVAAHDLGLGMKHRRTSMFIMLMKLWKNEDGATAIEYGLIAALIAVAAISAFQLVGTNLSNTFHGIATQL